MKTELPQIYFTFDPANQTIDFSSTPSFDPARLFAVMNITDQQKLIYAVASYAQGFGGSFSGSVLTLTYDTTAMSPGDILQVIYDDPSAIQDVEVTNFPSVQDVDVVSSVLPTDASTATLQGVGNASLSSIDGKIITTVDGIKVDGSAVTQPVSAVSLPLPSGASTEATLSSVDGKITVVDTSDVTITGALPTGTNTIGKVDVNGTIPVSGSVSVSNFPVTQDVNVTASVLPTGASTESTLSSLNSKVTAVDTDNVTITAPLPAGANLIGSVDINSGSIIADLIAEAPTGGAVPTDAVYIAGNDSGTLVGMKVSATGVVSVDGSATTQPVSASSLPLPTGASTEATLSSLDSKVTTTPNGVRVDPGSITIGSSVLPTGASTEATLSSIDTKLTTTPSGLRVDAVGTIDIGSSALPTGASTEATLSSIDSKLTTTPNGLRVDAVGTVDIGSSALPTGASTEATLSSIDSKLTTTPSGLRVDAVGTIDIGSSVLPTGASTEATLSNLDSKVTTTVNGVKVDAVVSSGQIDSYLHDGSGTAITSTTVSTKQAIDVNIASGTITVTATNPSVGTNNTPLPTSSTLIGGDDGGTIRPIGVTNSGGVNYIKVDTSGFISPSASTSSNQVTGNNSLASIDSKLPALTANNFLATEVMSIDGHDDTGNSSSTPLGANGVFTGTWYDITNYNSISLGVYSDQPSATNGLVAQYSSNAINVDHEHVYTYTAGGSGIGYNLIAEFKYFRIIYTNGPVAQTTFRIQSILKSTALFPSMYKLTNTLTDNSQAIVTRSVITGVTTGGGGGYVNVKVNPSGALVADVTGTVSATQSGTWDIANVTGTVSLPTGASTSANQTTANSSLSSIDSKLTSVTVGTLPSLPTGANTIGAVNVNGTVPVSAVSLPLPTGASTDTLQTSGNASLSSIDGKLTSGIVVSTLPSIPAGSNTIGAISNTSFGISGTLPAFTSTPTVDLGNINGISTSSNQTNGTQKTQIVDGSNNVIASTTNALNVFVDNQVDVNLTNTSIKTIVTNSKGEFIRSQYDLNPVNTSTYYQLIASTAQTYSAIEIFDSSGQTLMFAIGASGFEVDQFLIFPGGNGRIPYSLASGSRISIFAISGTASSGEICINFYV